MFSCRHVIRDEHKQKLINLLDLTIFLLFIYLLVENNTHITL